MMYCTFFVEVNVKDKGRETHTHRKGERDRLMDRHKETLRKRERSLCFINPTLPHHYEIVSIISCRRKKKVLT